MNIGHKGYYPPGTWRWSDTELRWIAVCDHAGDYGTPGVNQTSDGRDVCPKCGAIGE